MNLDDERLRREIRILASPMHPDPDPPLDLVPRTLAALRPALARARASRALSRRLALAGAAVLPVILAVNAAITWLVYVALDLWLPQEVAVGAAAIMVVTTLLGLAIAYGSLPLFVVWGASLRETA